jgi:parvulin-like peptidyl-prolyl isomerase
MADNNREENVKRRAAATARGTSRSENESAVNNRMADSADEISDTPLSMTSIRNKLLHGWGAKIVLGLLIFIFAIAGALFSASGPPAGVDGMPRNSNETVASLGGETIQRGRFDQMLAQTVMMQEQYGMKTGPIEYFGQAQSVLKNMADELAVYQAAVAAGITASDADIDKEIERLIDEQIKSQKDPDPAAFRRQVEAKYPGGENEMRDELRKQFDRELVRRSLVSKKFEEQEKAANKVTEEDYKRSITRLGLRQIVLRPAPPGPTEKDYAKAQEASSAKALKNAEALAAKLKSQKGRALTVAFATAARAQSTDAATKEKGGVVGAKLPSELPVGANVREALQKASGDVVGPVQDESTKDIYLFLIESRKVEFPKDYAKKKAELIKNFETQSDNEAWQKKQDAIKKAAQPDITAPALVAYKAQTEKLGTAPEAEKAALRADILESYQQALASATPLESTAIRYQMAQLYRDSGDKAKALETLKQAAQDSTAPQLQLEYARALRDAKKNKEALTKLNETSKLLDDNPSGPSMFGSNPDDQLRFQLATEYELLGDRARAAAERKKVKPAAQGGMPGGFGGMGGGSPIQVQPGR